jgi:hypothetical protein
MISFKQFLAEMPERIIWSKEQNKLNDYDLHDDRLKGHKISELGPYEVHRGSSGAYGTRYSLVHKQTGHVHMTVTGEQNKNEFRVSVLKGHDSKAVSADRFYHHLVHKHGITLVSDYSQSAGGHKVWQKLMKNPTLKVNARETTWDNSARNETKVERPVQSGDDNNYSVQYVARAQHPSGRLAGIFGKRQTPPSGAPKPTRRGFFGKLLGR